MSRSITTTLSVVAGLWLAACGGPDPQPLSAFTAYQLSVGSQAWVKDGGGVDPDYNQVALILYPPPYDPSVPYACLAISPKVTATLDGEVMRSYAEGSGPALGGCTEPVFTINVPKERYGAQGGNAAFTLTDDTHTVIAEFKDFYLPKSEETDASLLPVLKCEGVAECKGYKPARQRAP